jgi:hypothetical protein
MTTTAEKATNQEKPVIFDFSRLDHPVLVEDISQYQAEMEYHDKYMVVMNSKVAAEDSYIHGN